MARSGCALAMAGPAPAYRNGNRRRALGHYPETGVKAARDAAYKFGRKAAVGEAGSFKEVA